MRLSLLLVLFFTASTLAEPAIREVNIRGLQVGGTTTLIVDGDQLGANPKLLLPFATKQTVKMTQPDRQATFEVQLADTITPGFYPMSLVTEKGVSPPVVVAVDRLTQKLFNTPVESLPVALHGSLTGPGIVEVPFTGKANQKITIEVESQRIGGKLRPVVHLWNAKKLQLAWAWSSPSLSGDVRLEFTLPEDGKYFVTLHDLEYAGPAPGNYRLKIGQWSYIDQVFPPMIGKGSAPVVEMIGSTVGKLNVASQPSIVALDWPKDGLWSGPRPFVRTSPDIELVEQSTAEPQLLPAGRVGVSGRLLTNFEQDRYKVPVTPGQKIRFTVFADRIGSPIDTALSLRNEQNQDLVRVEDQPGSIDPLIDYTVPDKVTHVIAVVESQLFSGPRGVYRLVIEPQPVKDDFDLFTPEKAVTLPINGRAVIPVHVQRRGFKAPLTLTGVGLPNGVVLEGNVIPDDADGTLLTVQRGNATGDAVFVKLKSPDEFVTIKGHPLERVQPWLASEMPIAFSTAKASDFSIDWNLAPDASIVPGVKFDLPVKVTRIAGKETVRLTLLTSQLPPITNNQLNPALALRIEKPTEFAATVNEGVVPVIVPPQLNGPVYDVCVQADLLAVDKKTVLATAFAPVRRMQLKLPVAIKLDGPTRIETKIDPKTGATVKLIGKVERLDKITGDVVLTLTGLPPGSTAAPVTIKADAKDFVLNLVLPANTMAGEIKTLKLTANIAPDPKQPAVKVNSREVELIVVVAVPVK